jgi:hypothetical protein
MNSIQIGILEYELSQIKINSTSQFMDRETKRKINCFRLESVNTVLIFHMLTILNQVSQFILDIHTNVKFAGK